MSNYIQTCPYVLADLLGTQSREFSVIYVIEFILSHLELITPLYELFLEIIKAHGDL